MVWVQPQATTLMMRALVLGLFALVCTGGCMSRPRSPPGLRVESGAEAHADAGGLNFAPTPPSHRSTFDDNLLKAEQLAVRYGVCSQDSDCEMAPMLVELSSDDCWAVPVRRSMRVEFQAEARKALPPFHKGDYPAFDCASLRAVCTQGLCKSVP